MAATGEEVVTYKQLMNWGKTLSGGGGRLVRAFMARFGVCLAGRRC